MLHTSWWDAISRSAVCDDDDESKYSTTNQQRQLAKEVYATGCRDTYDFLYQPSDIAANQRRGYGFVNFVTLEAA